MRILAIANRYPPWSIGGYEMMTERAMHALHETGHETRVLTTLPDPSDRAIEAAVDADVCRELRWYWRDHAFLPLGVRATVALERENARVLDRHLSEFAPDVVLWWAMGGMSLSLIEQVRLVGLPALGVVGDSWMSYAPAVDSWTRRWRGRRRAAAPAVHWLTGVPARVELSGAARWVFISEHLRSIAQKAGLQLTDTLVAHPGIDPQRFVRHPPPPWRWRLLYCGRIDPRKGISTAVDALADLPAEAGLTIDGYGDPRHSSELRSLAARLGVGDRVEFRCSDYEQVPAAYAAADAIVFPVTWEEPWGLVPLEAMAVGRPVIASSAGGGAAEYLRDGYNCLQFPPGDAAALASALRRLEAGSELRGGLIDHGFETAARFTDRQFHETIERELERAVS